MPRDGIGGYALPVNSWNPAINGQNATAADWQALIDDVKGAIQQSISSDGQTPVTGSIDMNGNRLTDLGAGVNPNDSVRFAQLFSQGLQTNIAAAGTMDIGGVSSTLLNVTGSASITSFGTNYNGPRWLKFNGVCTLTHSSNLVLPGALNVVSQSGDVAMVMPEGNPATGWRVLVYQRADGSPVNVTTPEMFGARGEGATEDQNAINAAIGYISVMGGGVLRGTPGKRYLINGIVRLCDNLTLDMTGCTVLVGPWFAARALGQKAGVFMSTNQNAFTDTTSTAIASKNLKVIGGTYDGQNDGSAGVSIPAAQSQGIMFLLGAWGTNSGAPNQTVNAKAFTNATFKDVYFTRFCGDGIRAYHGTDITVDNCRGVNLLSDVTLSAGSLAQFLGTHEIIYKSNRAYNTTAALGWHGATFVDWERPIEALSCVGNISRNLNNGDGFSCEANNLVTRNVRWGTFSSNIVVDCNGNGIGVDGCSHVTVSGNAIRGVILGIVGANTPYLSISANYLQDCQGNAIFGGANVGMAVVGNVINGVTYYDSTYQGEAINIPFVSAAQNAGSQIIGNYAIDLDGAFCYDATNSVCADNTVVNAMRSNSPTRKYIIRTDSVRSKVRDNNISQGVGGTPNFAQAAIFVDDTVAVKDNIITGSFTLGTYFIGNHRGVAVNLGLTAANFCHDFDTKRYSFVASSAPAGSYFGAGDKFEFLSPVNGGWIGQVWTTANVWRNYGAIA